MGKQLYDVKGFSELQRKLEKLADARQARKAILPVMRVAARPTIKAARALAPKSDAPHHRFSGGEIVATYQPGNLSKSIGNITGKDRNNAVLFIGPRAGKNRKYDGYYGNFVEEGTVNMPAQPFMRPAFDQTKGLVTSDLEGKVVKKIEQRAKMLGL